MRLQLLLLCLAGPVAAQSVRARLEGRVPAEVIPPIDSLVQAAAAESLPAELLIQKAIEGGAKHVAPEYIVVAVRVNLDQLRRARNMLVDGGDAPPTTPDEVATLNSALKRGLTPPVVDRIVEALPAEPRSSAFHAVADLVEHGFDQDSAADLILAAAGMGLRGERLLEVANRAILELQSGRGYSEALGMVQSQLPHTSTTKMPVQPGQTVHPAPQAPRSRQ